MSWPAARVGDLAAQIRGVTFGKSDTQSTAAVGLIPIFTATNVTESGLSQDSVLYLPQSRVSKQQLLKKNDVLITTSSGSLTVVGRSVRVPEDLSASFGAFCKVLRPIPAVDPAYFAHYFRTPSYRARVSQLAAGANINNLRNEDLDNLEIPLPPLPEQRRIAAILDEVDSLRGKRRSSLTATRELSETYFADALETSDGELMALEQLFSVSGGKRLPKGEPYADAVTQHPYLRVSDMDDGIFRTTDLRYLTPSIHRRIAQYTVSEKDLVISIAGTIGLVASIPAALNGANLTENAARLRPKGIGRLDPTFMKYQLNSPFVQGQVRMATGQVTIGKLPLFRIERLLIRVPSWAKQAEIARHLSSLEKQSMLYGRHLQLLDELFASLQHRAFAGEL